MVPKVAENLFSVGVFEGGNILHVLVACTTTVHRIENLPLTLPVLICPFCRHLVEISFLSVESRNDLVNLIVTAPASLQILRRLPATAVCLATVYPITYDHYCCRRLRLAL